MTENDPNTDPSTSRRSSIIEHAAGELRGKAGDAADTLHGAGDRAASAARGASNQAAGMLETAKGAASDAGAKVSDVLEDQKAAGIEQVAGISGAIRRAADELGPELPPVAQYMRKAADGINSMAEAVRRRDVRQIVDDVQGFAKRQPAAFLGATVLGGFAVMRLLKAPVSTHAKKPAASPGSVAPAPYPSPSGEGSPIARRDPSIRDDLPGPGESGLRAGDAPAVPGSVAVGGTAARGVDQR